MTKHLLSSMRKIVWLAVAVVALGFSACRHSADREAEELQKKALAAEPSILDSDQLADIITSDTTHYKAVFIFDAVCKPCRMHLRNEVRQLYRDCDTSMWRIFLVAKFEGLSHGDPNRKDAFSDNIRHFASEYRTLLPSLGYDMDDVYFLYDARWNCYSQADMIERMFTSDQPYQRKYGDPRFLRADPHNHLCTEFLYICNEYKITDGVFDRSTIVDSCYSADEMYVLEPFDYRHHDTAFTVKEKKVPSK